jgi:xylan 1,4-beta-xylosidase
MGALDRARLMRTDRRDALKFAGSLLAGGLAGLPIANAAAHGAGVEARTHWRRGFDNQRIADLGDGRFLNPVLAGDHPDPSILKDGADYYATFSSFDACPGLVIWHSRDLVNWQPLGAALQRYLGSVWAPSLHKDGERYLLYFPVKAGINDIHVMCSTSITGPWSEPIPLGLHDHIDPCFAVGEDGSRWLFLSGGNRIRMRDDGLATSGAVEHVYDAWRYPEEWVVEAFSPEGPKIHRIGGWYYLLTAVGGTAGPPTGHMVIAARSRSIHGPWEQHPGNPLVHTARSDEAWWSRGHASLVQAPDGSWWAAYHGYEKGYWTLGRQCLLDPVEFGVDGWFRMRGGELSQPMSKPSGGTAVPHGRPLSDDFSNAAATESRWTFFRPAIDEHQRLRVDAATLHLAGRGDAPSSGSPLLLTAGDPSYRFECDIECAPRGRAGLVLFYDERLYCGLGFDADRFIVHQYGLERRGPVNPHGARMKIRLTNQNHIVTFDTSGDGGKSWHRFDRGMEVSGYHHNVRGGFLMLRPGLYAAGDGDARFRGFGLAEIGE